MCKTVIQPECYKLPHYKCNCQMDDDCRIEEEEICHTEYKTECAVGREMFCRTEEEVEECGEMKRICQTETKKECNIVMEEKCSDEEENVCEDVQQTRCEETKQVKILSDHIDCYLLKLRRKWMMMMIKGRKRKRMTVRSRRSADLLWRTGADRWRRKFVKMFSRTFVRPD